MGYSLTQNKVLPGSVDPNDSLDSFEEEVRRFDADFEKEKSINKEKFKGLMLEIPEV